MTKEKLLKFLDARMVADAAIDGREAVRTAYPDYYPEKPHMKWGARPDASIFTVVKHWDELVTLLFNILTYPENTKVEYKDNGDSVIVIVHYTNEVIVGITKKSAPIGEGPWVAIKTNHGMMVRGESKLEENPTSMLTLVFTNEGDAGFCLATVHPGEPETPGDYTGLSEGDLLNREDLEKRGITRVIPE